MQRPNKKKAASKPLSRKIRVLVLEDQEIVRNGIRALIEAEGWEICGETYNGREAIEKTKLLGPDIVVLDITLVELNGMQAARQILEHNPDQRIIILVEAQHSPDNVVLDCLRSGVQGYLLKSDPARDLVAAIKAVSRNTTYFTETAQIIAKRLQSVSSRGSRPRPLLPLRTSGQKTGGRGAGT